MSAERTVKFTHGQFGSDVVLFADAVFGVIYMPMQKQAAVIAVGGAAVPIKESQDEAIRIIATGRGARSIPTEGKNNGPKNSRISNDNKRRSKAR